jgi:hypothetical protein
VTFVRSFRPPSKEFANHQPRLLKADAKHVLHLPAEASYIYGGRLIFEQKHKNLGWWEREGDRAVWEAEIPAAGKYRVNIQYAAAPAAAGNRFLLIIGDQRVEGVVKATGDWDRYETLSAGTVELVGGLADIVLTNADPIHDELFDVREVILEPEASDNAAAP